MKRPQPLTRTQFCWFTEQTTRWNDIDVFGHVNNAEFYAFFDSAVLRYLHSIGAVAALEGDFATLVVESGARFHREVLFTDRVSSGVRVEKIGTSSVRYGIAVFANDVSAAAVDGFFVHVFVDRESRRPTCIPDRIRQALSEIVAE